VSKQGVVRLLRGPSVPSKSKSRALNQDLRLETNQWAASCKASLLAWKVVLTYHQLSGYSLSCISICAKWMIYACSWNSWPQKTQLVVGAYRICWDSQLIHSHAHHAPLFSATCCKKSWGFNDYLPSSSVTHIQTSLADDFIPAKSGSTLMSAYDPGGMLGTSLKWEGQGFGIAIPGMREIQSDPLKIQVSSTTRFGWRANFRHWLNHPLFEHYPIHTHFQPKPIWDRAADSQSAGATPARTCRFFLKGCDDIFRANKISITFNNLSQKPRYEPSWYLLL